MLSSPPAGSDSWAVRVLLLVALICAGASTGCGQRACIEWSAAEGACPSRAETPTHIGSCTNIVSIDGEGTHEGDLCCYPVTKQGPLPDCVVTETEGSGPFTSVSIGSGNGCNLGDSCGSVLGSGCSACAANNFCFNELAICRNNIPCNNILQCERSCGEGDLACAMKCEAPNPDGLFELRALNECVFCKACSNVCVSQCSGAQATTGATTGSSGFGGSNMSGAGGFGGAGGMSSASGVGGQGGAGGKGGAGGAGTTSGAGGKGGAGGAPVP